MSNTHLFITDTTFSSQRWSKAFPKAQVCVSVSMPPPVPKGSLVWILTSTKNWLELVAFYAQNDCKVIAMSRQQGIDELREALGAGARGYIEALSNVNTLQQVANSVSQNAMWLPATLVTQMIGTLSELIKPKSENPVDLAELTKREQEVTDAIVKGATNKEIARQLDITERTVKAHLSSIFSKLGVRDRMQLMLAVKGY